MFAIFNKKLLFPTLTATCAAIFFIAPVWVAAQPVDLKHMLASHKISDEQMGTLRGGMEINGLNFDFGIERMVMINGNVQLATQFKLSNVNVNNNLAAVALTNSPTALSPVVIQNTMNNQYIHAITKITIDVTDLHPYLQMLRNDIITRAIIRGIN